MSGPYAGLTGNLPRDPTTGALLVSASGTSLSLTGATASTRYVGGTTSGAPASGTFLVGDYVIDQSGQLWICTTAGSPGTWQIAGSGTELAYSELVTNPNNIGTTVADLTYGSGAALQVAFVAPSRAVLVEFWCNNIQQATAAGVPLIYVTDTSNAIVVQGTAGTLAINAFSPSLNVKKRLTLTAGQSYTWKVRANTSGASATAALSAGANLPAYLRVSAS